ncbi:hypothetical protein TNCV_4365051 [Trichonephila clavipes]|nr:hypothetical protein TNCV_4365051 [Trichonephila clavipes]
MEIERLNCYRRDKTNLKNEFIANKHVGRYIHKGYHPNTSLTSVNVPPRKTYMSVYPPTEISSETITGLGTLVVKVTDSWPVGHDFEPSSAEDLPCGKGEEAMPIFRNSNVLPLVGCGN